MASSSRKPVIGIPADRRMIGPHPFHAVGEKYITAVAHAADWLPLLIPVLETPLDVTDIRAVANAVPVFGVCRGFQEMNVAMGGTLHQRVHEIEGLDDHREVKEQPLEVHYGPAHEVVLEPDSTLRRLAGKERV